MFLGHNELVDVLLSLHLLIFERLHDLFGNARAPRVELVDRNAENWLSAQIMWTDRRFIEKLIANQRRVVRVALLGTRKKNSFKINFTSEKLCESKMFAIGSKTKVKCTWSEKLMLSKTRYSLGMVGMRVSIVIISTFVMWIVAKYL